MTEHSEVLARAKRDAAAHKFPLNPSKKHVDGVIKGLIRNKHQYGEYYCPCKVITGDKKRDADIICMCRVAREKKRCICGLFVDPAAQNK